MLTKLIFRLLVGIIIRLEPLVTWHVNICLGMLITPLNLDSPFQNQGDGLRVHCILSIVKCNTVTASGGEEGCHSRLNEDNGDSFI